MKNTNIKLISECYIKPKVEIKESKQPYYFSPWDLIFLSGNHIEYGLVFQKPQSCYSTSKLLSELKDSISNLLVHFYPLAGQLVTQVDEQQHRCLIYVDCNKGPGVRFIHASLDIVVSNVLTPTYVPPLVKLLFDRKSGGINYEGHNQPLFSVQVTELADGVFLGITLNHMMVDGTGFWHFLRCWSEIYQAKCNGEPVSISHQPLLKRWLPDGYGPKDLYFPYTHPNEFLTSTYQPPPLSERFFYFSSNTVKNLKAKANEQTCHQYNISSFQALLALVWRSIIRARNLPLHETVDFRISADVRNITNPPLPQEYFGNAISPVVVTTTVKELMKNDLGLTAELLHKAVMVHREKGTHEFFKTWFESPYVQKRRAYAGAKCTVFIGSSHRADVFKNEFGILGKPIAVRMGTTNKFDGKVYAHPGTEGGDSVDLEVCLLHDSMTALESDHEFMAAISPSPLNHTTTSKVASRL